MTTDIPRPPSRLVTRIALPATLVLAALGALAWTGWRTLAPVGSVEVVPVSLRAASAPPAAGVDRGSTPTPVELAGGSPNSGSPATAEGPPVQAPGWIEPSPFPVAVPALVAGTVRSVLVLEGAHVDAGQVVAELVDDEARIEVRLAEASLAEAGARLREAQDEHARKSKLVASGAASAGEVARLAIRIDALRAAVDAATAQRDLRALNLERTKVRAPSAGVVMSRMAVPGMPAGGMRDAKPILELYDPSQLQVRADVPLADAGRVAVGDRAEIAIDVLPGRTLRGEVIRMVQQADIAKNTVQAKVRILDAAPELKPEMLARVRILPRVPVAQGRTAAAATPASKATPWLPDGCIDRDGAAPTVLVVADIDDGRGIVERRTVETGSSQDGWTEVRSGLRAGDLAVARPADAPAAGSRVRIVERWRNETPKEAHDGRH
jgi:RND family efflux transporter MFP subunit